MVSKYSYKYLLIRKAISSALLAAFFIVFTLSDAWAVVEIGNGLSNVSASGENSHVPFDIKTISIPADLGSIEDSYKGGSGRIVVHIQDAHCNYAAQHKIAGLIEYLSKEYGITSVNLEGGKGRYDLPIFSGFPHL